VSDDHCTECAAAIDGCPEGAALHFADHGVTLSRFRYAAGEPYKVMRDAIDKWNAAHARYAAVLSRRARAAEAAADAGKAPRHPGESRSMPAAESRAIALGYDGLNEPRLDPDDPRLKP
jgi:hypothetical protein